jgi:drug/metabolite transporter (DMT)-like permease
LQVLLLAFAGVCILYGQHNFAIRLVGLLAIFGGLVLVRNSRRPSPAIRINVRAAFSVKPWQWLVGLALVAIFAAALAWLFYDAATGYRSGTAPIYVFGTATLLVSLWWGRDIYVVVQMVVLATPYLPSNYSFRANDYPAA